MIRPISSGPKFTVVVSLSLAEAGGQAAEQVPAADRVEDDDGQGREHHRGGDRGHVDPVLALEVPQGDQVDLQGPEPEYQQESTENPRVFTRRAVPYRLSRQRQVTGNQVYAIQKNQLVKLDQQPEWLVKYYESPGRSESQKNIPLRAKSAPKSDGPIPTGGYQKAAVPAPAPAA